MSKLIYLDLWNNYIINDITPLSNLKSLRALVLWNTFISEGVPSLIELPQLQYLDVEDNPDIPCNDLEIVLNHFVDATIFSNDCTR